MDVQSFLARLRRAAAWIVLAVLLGTAGGAVYGLTRPASFQSKAVTSVGPRVAAMTPDAMYALNQAIRGTMPAYLAMSTGQVVIDGGSRTGGLTASEMSSGLSTTREPDSTVISWTMASADPDAAQRALAGAVSAFSQQVSASAPRDSSQQPMVAVFVSTPATVGVHVKTLGTSLAAVLGALGGLALIVCLVALWTRVDRRVVSRESVERELGIPVLAEVGSTRQRADAWVYAGSFLARRGVSDRVLILGSKAHAQPSDVDALERALAAAGSPTEASLGPDLADTALPQAAAESGAIVMLLLAHRDDVDKLESVTNSLVKVCAGPVVSIIDKGRYR